jgi:hypothetical protein
LQSYENVPNQWLSMMQQLRLLHQGKTNRDFAAQVQVEEELMKTRL